MTVAFVCSAQGITAGEQIDLPTCAPPDRGHPAAAFTKLAACRTPQAQAEPEEEPNEETGEENQPDKKSMENEGVVEAAKTAFENKQYISAWHLDPAGYPLLSGIDAPSAAAGPAVFAKSGMPGTSRLREWTTNPAISTIDGGDTLAAAIGIISLDAGTPNQQAEIGGPGPRVTAPTTRLGIGFEPELAWSREGTISPFAAVGATPVNGVVGPTVAGRLGAVLQLDEAKLTSEAYRQSIAESILSYTGIVDPTTRIGFGRVVETGGRLGVEYPVAERLSLDGAGSAGIVRGMNVADNTHFSVQIAPSYDLHLPSFDSFSIGPSYQYDRFNRNLSEFTFGHGGYFSPQANHKIGASVNLQSAEGRDFIIRAELFAGWETNFQASSPVFPLSNSGERFPAVHQAAASVTGEGAFAYRVTPRLILGGLVRVQQSPQYNDVLVGLSLKLSWGDRPALFGSDLPTAAALIGPTER